VKDPDLSLLAHPKRLEFPQWIQQQTKIRATEMAVLAEEQKIADIAQIVWNSAIAAGGIQMHNGRH